MITTQQLNKNNPLVFVTCYDFTFARILDTTQVDALLVGDSVAMTVHGEPTTLSATTDMIATHTRAVAKGAPHKCIVADMPFLSVRKGLKTAMDAVDALMKAGAHAVKIEGLDGHEKIIAHIIQSGVPVMGHLGLTPQFVHGLGGYKVQGKGNAAEASLLQQAKTLEDLGVFSLVLECIPTGLAKAISDLLAVPTIGIGAGNQCDGQILVLQDLLGLNLMHQAKFVRQYMQGAEQVQTAVEQFVQDIHARTYPSEAESYH